jgi:hypothetical protein
MNEMNAASAEHWAYQNNITKIKTARLSARRVFENSTLLEEDVVATEAKTGF